MKTKSTVHRISLRLLLSLTLVLGLLGVAIGAFAFQKLTSSSAHGRTPQRTFALNLAHPQYWMGGKATLALQLPCMQPGAAPRCFTPQQIQNAYNVAPLYKAGITGKGHTIVIVDAFQSPTIRHDLHVFDQIFGLNDPTLRIFAPDGLAPFNAKDPAQVAWAAEITLDVEWAHAIAPDAAINLVLSNPLKGQQINTFSGFLLNMLRATSFAVTNNLGDVISQSFGGNEMCASQQALQAQHQVFQMAAQKKITLLAASGDRGAAEINCGFNSFVKAVSTPASDPLVTAVGGTTLNTTPTTGIYQKERGWIGSGGGFSVRFAKPMFQQGIAGIGTQRGLPDIAYNADPQTGVLVIWSSSGQGQDQAVVFGGTSAGSPQWAGMVALLNQSIQGRAGWLNGALYRLSKSTLSGMAFHDILTGNNNFNGKSINAATVHVQGFMAEHGWDAVTGLGTPNAARMITLLPRFL